MHWQHSNQTGGETITFELEIAFRNVDNSLNPNPSREKSSCLRARRRTSLVTATVLHSVKDRKFASKSALEETRTRLRSSLNPLSKASPRC